MDLPRHLRVDGASHVGTARRLAAALCRELGFGEVRAGEAALVVTELGTNLLKHTGGAGGTLVFRPLQGAGGAGLDILSLDQGPGIANIGECLRDGYPGLFSFLCWTYKPYGTEFAGVSHRYHTAVMQIASLGRRSGTLVRMNDIGKSAMAAGLAAGKPGRPVGDMERAAFAVVREMGRDPGVLMRYGYGIGIAYPPSWLEPLHVISESDDVLEVGMTLMLHVLGIGGTYEVTVDGPKLLCGAQELRFVE